MESASLRDRLHEYIDKADERKLSAIYVLIEDELDEEPIYNKETIVLLAADGGKAEKAAY